MLTLNLSFSRYTVAVSS